MNLRSRMYAIGSTLLLSACGPHQVASDPKEMINATNNPNGMVFFKESLNGRLASLPDSGAVESYWYNGDYYPFTMEGIGAPLAGQSLSPVEKYDRAFAQGSAATDWEKKYHGTHGSRQPETWEGHCNGVAASIAVAPEPRRSVSYNGVTFTPDDLKALLAESLYRAETQLVGSRCDTESLAVDAQGRMLLDSCRDINPGAFHVIITNMIGIKKKIIIADVTVGREVWNYPLVAFNVLEKRELSSAEAQALSSRTPGSSYSFNSSAMSFVYVKSRYTYVTSRDQDKVLEYILELDGSGKIIGGEWVGASKQEHPDFLWMTGDPQADNPHIDFYRVKSILVQSFSL